MKHVLSTIVSFLTLLALSVPAKAALSNCQHYLLEVPIKPACGSMCGLYVFRDLLEGHIQKPIFTEYALLALGAYEVRLARFYHQQVWGKNITEQVAHLKELKENWNTPVPDLPIAFSIYGVLPDDYVHKKHLANIFKRVFDQEMTSENVQRIVENAINELIESLENSQAGDQMASDRGYGNFLEKLDQIVSLTDHFRPDAISFWRKHFGDLQFTIYDLSGRDIVARFKDYIKNHKTIAGSDVDLQIYNTNSKLIGWLLRYELWRGRPVFAGFGKEGSRNFSLAVMEGVLGEPEPKRRIVFRDSMKKNDATVGTFSSTLIQDLPEDMYFIMMAKKTPWIRRWVNDPF